MLFQDKLTTTLNRPNLFGLNGDSYNEIKNNLFEEEKIKEDKEEEISVKTPTIRVLTPVRKKKVDFKNIFDNANFDKIFEVPHIKKVEIDCSDEDEVNNRVRKLISNNNNVDYSDEPDIVKSAVWDAFEEKYRSLSNNYPDYTPKFSREKNLNNIHKNYHQAIRTIYANLNIGQSRLAYIIILLFVEVFCIKVFNLPMAGFTKMEMKRMYKYNTLMIELGESMYPVTGEGEKQSIEWRIGTSFLWNIVIFLAIKLLVSYLGGESMIGDIRKIIDKLFDNDINIENIETGEAKNINKEETDILSSLFESGDGTSELGDFISSLGNAFTQNLENNRKGPQPRNRTRPIFD